MAWFRWYSVHRADQEIDDEHPIWTIETRRASRLLGYAVRIAAEVPGDSEAIAAVNNAGGKSKDIKRAAALIRADRYRYEHRRDRRAARLLMVAADGSPLVTPSRDEEALFAGVDSLEGVSVEEAFAALAAEAPALRELERQVMTSRSVPGWGDREVWDRMDEILYNLDQLAGPRVLEGTPLVRSELALGYARIYLLGIAVLLIEGAVPDPENARSQNAGLLRLLALTYEVRPDMRLVARAIGERLADHSGFRALAVLSLMLQEPGMDARLRRGEGPSDLYMQAINRIFWNGPPGRSPGEFIDAVVGEVRSAILRSPGSAGEERKPDS